MNELTKINPYFDEKAWSQMGKITESLLKSGALPQGINNGHQVMMIMQAGKEMGLKPMEALNALYIVNGSINLWGKSLIGRFREFGYQIQFTNEKENTVTAEVTKGDEKYIDTFTFDDADLSGWTKTKTGSLKFGWSRGINRKRKLRYGVLSLIAHTYIPEVLGSAIGVVEISQDYIEASGDLDLPLPPKKIEKELNKLQNDDLSKVEGEVVVSAKEEVKTEQSVVPEVGVVNKVDQDALAKAQKILDEKRKKLKEKAR